MLLRGRPLPSNRRSPHCQQHLQPRLPNKPPMRPSNTRQITQSAGSEHRSSHLSSWLIPTTQPHQMQEQQALQHAASVDHAPEIARRFLAAACTRLTPCQTVTAQPAGMVPQQAACCSACTCCYPRPLSASSPLHLPQRRFQFRRPNALLLAVACRRGRPSKPSTHSGPRTHRAVSTCQPCSTCALRHTSTCARSVPSALKRSAGKLLPLLLLHRLDRAPAS
jgi:hypothetical protein